MINIKQDQGVFLGLFPFTNKCFHNIFSFECLNLVFWHFNVTGGEVKSGCEARHFISVLSTHTYR